MIVSLNSNDKCLVKCDNCGALQYRGYVSTIRAKRHFCDIDCRTEFEKEIEHKPAWKGGKVSMLGYVFLKVKDHPYANKEGYVKRSRLVMEKFIGRYLQPQETIHHINEIRNDDRIENLKLCSCNGEHMRLGHSKINKKIEQLAWVQI